MKSIVFSILSLSSAVVSAGVVEPTAFGTLQASLDTRIASERVMVGEDHRLVFAYNNTAEWNRGGDESAAAATIRITEMDARGVGGDPSQWTEGTELAVIACPGAEGLSAWDCNRRMCLRAELLVAGDVRGTAYFDGSASAFVVAVLGVDDISLDTRPIADGARAMEGMEELLPLARTNVGDWRMGGMAEGSPAEIVVTPVVSLLQGGAVSWLSVGESETLVTATGEGVYDEWVPTMASYRVQLTSDGTVLESVIVDMSGYAERRCGKVTITNWNCPQVGKPLTVSIVDGAGNEVAPSAVSWSRSSADRTVTTVLSVGAVTYEPVAEDLEHWVTLSVGDAIEDEPVLVQDIWMSKLPVVYVATDGGGWPSAAKEEHSGTFRLQGNAEWQSDKVLYDGKLDKIHVRGNSTKDFPKKPYKLKLDKKANLLGMGKNKHWVLLANYQDPGLMRNKTTYDFSAELGLVAMASEWVDVVFNGEFVGNYLLCEHIRIDEERIDIHNWEDTAEATAAALAAAVIPEEGEEQSELEDALADSMTADLGWLTTGVHTLGDITYTLAEYGIEVSEFDLSGGYVYELDRYDDETSKFRVTSGKIIDTLVKISAPETLGTNQQLMDEQQAMWTQFFAAVQGEDGYADGKSWAEMADARSMAAYWLTQVLSANYDMPMSRYAYRDQGGPLTFGPAWDFDHAYGGRTDYWTLTADANGMISSAVPPRPISGWLSGVATDPGYIFPATDNFYPLWVDDPYFCLELYELWQEKRDYFFELVADGGTLDRNYAYLQESALANDARWQVRSGNNVIDRFDGELGSAKRMKACLRNQVNWVDMQMYSLGTLVASLYSVESDHPYTNATDRIGVEIVTEHKDRVDGREGETADVVVSDLADVEVKVELANLSGSATIGVYVNALAYGTYPVNGTEVGFTVCSNAFTRAGGRRNMLSLVVRDGEGAMLATTYALITTTVAGYEPQRLDRAMVAIGEEDSDSAGWPTVSVRTKGGRKPVVGRDYQVEFERVSATLVRVVVTGLGGYDVASLADGQVNLVGKVEVTYDSGASAVPVAGGTIAAKFDTRGKAVYKLMDSRELLPFAWNNAVGWPQGGEGETQVTVTLQPMTGGDPTDPTGWTAAGEGETLVNAAGEGVKRPRGLQTMLYKAKLTDGAAIDETAYFDLTEMAYKQGLMLIFK